MDKSFRVVAVEPGSAGVEAALTAVHRLFEDDESLALVPAGDATALSAVAAELPIYGDEPSLVLSTSGSTGQPKAVEIGVSALAAAAEAAAVQLRSQAVWLTALPVTSMGGLNTVIRSALAGTAPVIWDGVGGAAKFDPADFIPFLRAVRRSATKQRLSAATSLVPTQLHRLSESAEAMTALAELDYVLVGGSAVPESLRSAAETAGVNLIRTYGATETCGGIVYDGWPLPDCEVRIEDGEVVLAGPTLAHCYRDGSLIPASGWHTGDRGSIENGRLQVLGRSDAVIKVAGHKVDLAALAAAAGGDAVAVGRSDDEYGQTPIVAYTGAETEAAVASRIRAALPLEGIPLSVVRLPEMPQLPNGKPDLAAVLRLCETPRP